ncbi:RNA polymerase sigma factor [Planomonospora parontospora]|uniref:RNA polymerase sigma factor n=1 Tax=Planomonospora parontospora TaxID=58119 RepID=UPI00166F70F8|nr:RNA polymerase sigma factor [Planomonospora parontospora]GGL32776.1 siderophore-interacting protein [Planomonospora parontospora subsp. antibiotica]GII17029.1 siderophore-interacting protein [Planomonospora parontospora subsp. antibiotica]
MTSPRRKEQRGPPDPQRRFEEIYTAHYPGLLAYVRRRTASPDDAADALAETFTTAWRRLDDVPEGHAARLWLYGTARRVLANGRRAADRRTELAVRLRAELAVWAEHTGDAGPAGHDPGGVREAFRRLSADDRELLALVSWEGLDAGEIATVLGCSRGAVRLRLHRARKRLARELDSAGLDPARYGSRAAALAKGEV